MQTPQLLAKFAVLKLKWVTYVIRADPMRKYLGEWSGVGNWVSDSVAKTKAQM